MMLAYSWFIAGIMCVGECWSSSSGLNADIPRLAEPAAVAAAVTATVVAAVRFNGFGLARFVVIGVSDGCDRLADDGGCGGGASVLAGRLLLVPGGLLLTA